MNATRNAIFKLVIGKTCCREIWLLLLLAANTTAKTVDIASNNITNFMSLSKILYFPIKRIYMHKKIISIAQSSIFELNPKSSMASPAVTIVTADWIVNIVTRDKTKYVIKTGLPIFRYPSNKLSPVAAAYFGP